MAGGQGGSNGLGVGVVAARDGFSDKIYRNGSSLAVAAVYDRRKLARVGTIAKNQKFLLWSSMCSCSWRT